MTSLQQSEMFKRISISLESGWLDFENEILRVSEHPRFAEYLKSYRGISEIREADSSLAFFAGELTRSVLKIVEDAVSSGLSGKNHAEASDFSAVLKSCEGALNLALYFWHYPDERNFQFRTVIHFLNVPLDAVLLSTGRCPEFYLRMTEWGIQLSESDIFEPFPFRFSLERACGLNGLNWEMSGDEQEDADRIAKLRVVQREFCQLIDEWEHCNSILAVRQFALRKMSSEEQENARIIFSEISRSRDLLAGWCTGSAADLQWHVSNGLSCPDLHPDVKSELIATDALLLSGFQKFFLPASVSRHVYGANVLHEFHRFNKERLRVEPDDMYAMICEAAFSVALGTEVDWHLLVSTLEKKSFSWSLSADPSSAVKSVSWSFSAAEHHILTMLLILSVHAKREPNPLDSYWLQTVASVVEIPSTFGRSGHQYRPIHLNALEITKLKQRAISCLSHFENETQEETLTAWKYVVEFLNSDFQVNN